MPQGISFNPTAPYASQIKMYHTRDPATSALYRVFETPSNQVASQQLNQQGLFPIGNSQADFQGGQYPATIRLKERPDAPESCRFGQKVPFNCNTCCPGEEGKSMKDIVQSSKGCCGGAVLTPSQRGSFGICKSQVQAMEQALVKEKEKESVAVPVAVPVAASAASLVSPAVSSGAESSSVAVPEILSQLKKAVEKRWESIKK
jgi:hypothetical protein